MFMLLLFRLLLLLLLVAVLLVPARLLASYRCWPAGLVSTSLGAREKERNIEQERDRETERDEQEPAGKQVRSNGKDGQKWARPEAKRHRARVE